MNAAEYRFTIDQKGYQCPKHRHTQYVRGSAVDWIDQPAAAAANEVAAVLLAEHRVAWPCRVQVLAQQSLGSSVGNGHFAAIGFVMNLGFAEMTQDDGVGLLQRGKYPRQRAMKLSGVQSGGRGAQGPNVTYQARPFEEA